MSTTHYALPLFPADFPAGEAVISDDGLYRYTLDRRWEYHGPVMCWIGLNPSTADAGTDDPTIRRMCGFARREGCRGICVLNLYALRSPSPSEVSRFSGDPVGPDNDRWLAGIAGNADGPVVAAWGASPLAASRLPRLRELLAGLPLMCLGTTKSGAPRHPLYARGDTPLTPLTSNPAPRALW